MTWDLIIIVLAIYNAILVPYEFAYTVDTNIFLIIFDRIVDVAFIVDIAINFRTAYINKWTGKIITDGRVIAAKYVIYGRFWIDFVASLPLEVLETLFSTPGGSLKFFTMLKLVRILRLGRMISYLKSNQGLKFSLKIFQLIFFILISIHWTNWAWFLITEDTEVWFPAKDLDHKHTVAFSGDPFEKYVLFYYYGMLTLIGNDLIPTDYSEIIFSIIMGFVGMIFIGMVIGEFTTLLSNLTKHERIMTEETDLINNVMLTLHLPEKIQSRVTQYYEDTTQSLFIHNPAAYRILSFWNADFIKLFQIRNSIYEISFLDAGNKRQIDSFVEHLRIEYSLPGDIILKQGGSNQKFYYIHEGLVEVAQHVQDFEFYDIDKSEAFFGKAKGVQGAVSRASRYLVSSFGEIWI